MKHRSRVGKGSHVKRRTRPGASPGLVMVDPAAPPPTFQLIRYGPEAFEEIIDPSWDEISHSLGKWPVVWLNVEGLGDAAAIERLGAIFQLHRLALEDVVNVHQRPKTEEYGDRVYFVAPMVVCGERLESEQLSLFLGPGFVLTFQEGHPGDPFASVRERARTESGRMRTSGADYLAYAVIDALIDGYYPVLERYGERLDTLEERMFESGSSNAVALDELHAVRGDLRHLRRFIWPQREAVASLLRETTAHITAPTRVYLRDCYDHVIQMIDLLETYRELSADLRDLYLSSVSNRINETMRVLTIISTIFIPLTFIAGIYGMNFDTSSSPWNMPELKWYLGYPFCLALMICTTLGMGTIFICQGWMRWPWNRKPKLNEIERSCSARADHSASTSEATSRKR